MHSAAGTGRGSRRRILAGAGGAALGLLVGGARPGSATTPLPASAILPPDIGQSDLQVFIPETGHSLQGILLDYWRATGGSAIYGDPISEPFATSDGLYSQAFERAVFQYRPDFLGTEDPIIRLMPLGQVAFHSVSAVAHGDLMTRRLGIALEEAHQPLDPGDQAVIKAIDEGGRYEDASGHTLRGDFLTWYDRHEGDFYLGRPLTEAVYDGIGVAQCFDSGVLRQEQDEAVRLVPVVQRLASELGIALTPIEQGELPTYTEALLETAPNPRPEGDPGTHGRRWIDISLGQQQLWAYQSGTIVLRAPISSGLTPNDTSRGRFHVRLKYPSQTMRSFTGATREVIGVGDRAPIGAAMADANEVPDVPNVLYFSLLAEALHGTYWHDNFGTPMSHGCVNLPTDVAAWMYGWAPLGTEVIIRD